MVKYETNIDNIALQIDSNNQIEQRDKFSLLQYCIRNNRLGSLEKDTNSLLQINKYNLLSSGRKIFTIHSGSTRIKDELTGLLVNQYYTRIRFAGLKSYNKKQDNASSYALMTICAWLNTTGTKYRLVELDVAIDVNCGFDNILAVCVDTSPKTNYHEAGYKQYFEGAPTSYIEKYSNKEEAKNAVVRAYLYDKSKKEELLNTTITRFELKLQNRFFLRNDFTVESIVTALDKYYLMYFNSMEEKELRIRIYNYSNKIINKELYRLGVERYRVYPNPDVIKEFIRKIKSVYVGFYGDIIIPMASLNINLIDSKII